MTLENYIALIQQQHDNIAVHLYNAKCDLNADMTEEVKKRRESNVELYDAKLDMMKWVLEQAKKIETPKTKMREFL